MPTGQLYLLVLISQLHREENIFIIEKQYKRENILNGMTKHWAPRWLQDKIRFDELEITLFPLTYEG